MISPRNEKTFSFSASNRANIFPLSMAQSDPASDQGADHSVAGWACGALWSNPEQFTAAGLCGFTRLISAAHGVLKGLTVYVSSGSRDPVSTGTKMLQPMLAQYQAAGLKVQHKFNPEARHELLNETNREECGQQARESSKQEHKGLKGEKGRNGLLRSDPKKKLRGRLARRAACFRSMKAFTGRIQT
jgi:hypothetical protein